jgi:hypothetical protein
MATVAPAQGAVATEHGIGACQASKPIDTLDCTQDFSERIDSGQADNLARSLPSPGGGADHAAEIAAPEGRILIRQNICFHIAEVVSGLCLIPS